MSDRRYPMSPELAETLLKKLMNGKPSPDWISFELSGVRVADNLVTVDPAVVLEVRDWLRAQGLSQLHLFWRDLKHPLDCWAIFLNHTDELSGEIVTTYYIP